MTALANNRPVSKFGDVNAVLIPVLAALVANNVHLFSGGMVSLDATGLNLVASTTTTGPVVGVLRKEINNTSGAAVSAEYCQGAWPMNSGAGNDAITAANMFADCYVIDDNTVGLTDGGVGRPRAGYVVGMSGTMPIVMVGVANPFAEAPTSVPVSGQAAFTARAVMTSLAANVGTGTGVLTASANGALAAQDGVTLAVGDFVFIQEGTTNLAAAKDAGPWQVTGLGGAAAKWTLARPAWWLTGDGIVQAKIVDVGGEGTAFAGTQWKTFAAKGKIIGTDAPVFWPKTIFQSVTLVAGTAAAITTIPVRSALSQIVYMRTTVNTSTATISYQTVPAPTPGVTGSSSIVPMATVGAGTINNADISTLLMSVTNW